MVNFVNKESSGVRAQKLNENNEQIVQEIYNVYPVETAQGIIVSFSDGADGIPMKSLVANISPVQEGEGEPSPSNVRPITGWTECNVTRTGINIWNESVERGTISSITGMDVKSSNNYRSIGYIPCKPNTKYYAFFGSGEGVGSESTGLYIRCYDANKNYINSLTSVIEDVITTPTNCYYIRLVITNLTGDYTNDISINYPHTVTGYVHHTGNTTHSVAFPIEAGTVYGGTLDVTSGVLTVTYGITILDGTQTWIYLSEGYYTRINNMKLGFLNPQSLCDRLPFVLGTSNPGIQLGYNGNTNASLFVRQAETLTGATTPSELNEWFSKNNTTVIYPLATPITYQLSANQINTLYKQNNVWADSGNISVDYRTDVKQYVEQLTQPSEDDMTANANISSGVFFMVGNRLFLSTATIASGDSIIPGTNCTELSLADALNNLN